MAVVRYLKQCHYDGVSRLTAFQIASRFCGAFLFCSLLGCEEPRPASENPIISRLSSKYNLEIVTAGHPFPTSTYHGDIGGADATDRQIQDYLRLLDEEFSLYPEDFVRRTGLKRIVLCRELSFAGQFRNAVPDFEHDTYYLEIERGSFDTTYLRKVIHHDFFHIVDYRDDGLLYEDDRWKALNPDDFKYGTGGKNAQNNPESAVLTLEYPGFLNHYSTTGVEEDKAEIFSNMMVSPRYVAGRLSQDTVIEAKVVTMKELLAGFCPEINESFWQKVDGVQRND